jgi:diguanylate cyclase (GGDEF)-like protein
MNETTGEIHYPEEVKTSKQPEIQQQVDEEVTKLRKKDPLSSLAALTRHARDRVAAHIWHKRGVKKRQELEERVRIDQKTGLPNAKAFEELAERECERIKRNPGSNRLIIAISDIDNFGSYNSTYGELQGDTALRTTAEAMTASARATDIVGRWGGEEYAICMPYQVDSAGPVLPKDVHPLERMRRTVTQKSQNELPEQLTVSIGGTEYDPHESFSECFQRASLAELTAKLLGKNRTLIAKK